MEQKLKNKNKKIKPKLLEELKRISAVSGDGKSSKHCTLLQKQPSQANTCFTSRYSSRDRNQELLKDQTTTTLSFQHTHAQSDHAAPSPLNVMSQSNHRVSQIYLEKKPKKTPKQLCWSTNHLQPSTQGPYFRPEESP